MSWQLRVYTPTGGPHVPGSQIANYDANSPGGIVEGFHWSCSPHGDCLQMEFTAVPRLVDIPPRAVVQLLVGGSPAFYGFVTRSWPPTTGRAERYVALGASQLLRQRYANVTTTDKQDIARVVHAVMQFNHPAIHYSGSPPDTGYTLASFKAPWVDIATILKDLSGAAGGVPYGVRADGTFFFQRSTSATPVSYDSANIRHLPVEGGEVVDTVRLLHPETGFSPTYFFGRGYDAERTVIVPQMHNYMDQVPGTFHTDGVVTDLYGQPTALNPLWLYDDAPTTGHIISLNPPRDSNCFPEREIWRLWGLDFRPDDNQSNLRVLIWRAQATLGTVEAPNHPPVQNLGIRLTYFTRDGSYWYDFGPSSGHTILRPIGDWERGVALTLGGRATSSCPSFSLSVFQFAIYTPSLLLDQLALSLVQTPYRTPSEVRIPGYTPPTTHLTILNTPSGDVTGPVARWEYIYTAQDGIVSVANIGQPGTTGEAEAIKILATQISAEGDTRLRW